MAADVAFYGFRSGWGGIPRVVSNLISQIVAFGFKVDLLLHETDIPEIECLPSRVRRFELGQGGRLRKLSEYLEQTSPAAVISLREPANRILILAKKISRCKTRAVFRVGTSLSTMLKREPWPKRILKRASIRFFYKRADLIIANQTEIVRDIRKICGVDGSKIHVIPNPTVSHKLFEQAQAPPQHPWLQEKSKPVVVSVGRLVKTKDFSTLIRAFKELRCHLEANLIIIGEGKERERLERLSQELELTESVDFPGHFQNPFSILSRADLFVLSSTREGLPNALIEALALGVPVVATDCRSGPREILQDGKYGPLVPIGDYKKMADAMLSVLRNPPARNFLRKAVERYEAERCTKKYLEVIGLW